MSRCVPRQLRSLHADLRIPKSKPRIDCRSQRFSSSKPSLPIRKGSNRLRYLSLFAGSLIAVGIYDYSFQSSAIGRSLRTAYTGIVIALDYKLNFKPRNAKEINALHQRVADRLHYLCVTNAGLYIKLGQALGMQAAILPAPYREAFANIFDAAPPLEWPELTKVFQAEFGQSPTAIFDTFDEKPIAAASIAQVHKATLNGQIVAVKIQRPEIAKQIEWDLFSFKLLMKAYEWLFEMPTSFATDYIAQQIRKETSFTQEARNAEEMSAALKREPSLRDRIAIPKVYWEQTTERVMTAEFATGACRINDTKKIVGEWNLSIKDVMSATTEMLAAMIFKIGLVHCEPFCTPFHLAKTCVGDLHFGNVLVRPHPNDPRKPQIVLIDHGLYIRLSEQFRRDYSLLWRSLFVMDTDTIDRITKSWGIGNADMFASATLLRPFQVKRKHRAEDQERRLDPNSFEAQQSVKERLKSLLVNEQLIPRELIFLARCMRMNQATNQVLGSPVNRINILAHWAVTGMSQTAISSNAPIAQTGVRQWFSDTLRIAIFKITLLFIDVGFLLTRIRQRLLGREEGFEDLLQKQITQMARDEFGVELDQNAYICDRWCRVY